MMNSRRDARGRPSPPRPSASAALVLLACAIFAGAAAAQDVEPGTAAATAAAPAENTETAICTDRPAKASAPCTVEAGRFQLETDLFNGTFQRLGGVTTDTYLATDPTLKYGLSPAVDVEISAAPYEVVRTHGRRGDTHVISGVGDVFFRLKYNFYNAKDGVVQLAVIPYLKAPMARAGIGNGEVEGGALLPVAFKVTEALSLTTVPEFDAYADASGGGRHFNTSQLLSAAYTLPHGVTLYGEVWGDWNFDPAGEIDQYSADVAVAWLIGSSLQLDGGLNLGLNHDTPGVQAYVGVSQKF